MKKWLTWPFVALWRLLTAILELIGRIFTGITGVLFLIFGAMLAATVVAAPVGIVFLIIGILLVIRSIF